MPGPNFVLDKGYQPTGAVRQFRAVRRSTTNKEQCAEVASAGVQVLGICQEEITAANATSGRVANIRILGISRCIASAAIAIDAKVAVTNDGRMATAVSTNTVVGIAQTAAAAAGDHFDVLLVSPSVLA